jgi:hypothetical protein
LSDTTSRVISVRRDCAASITASRSLSRPRLSPVALRLTLEPCAQPLPDRIEPIGDHAREIGLARPKPVGRGGDPTVELGARLGEGREALLDRLLPLLRRLPLTAPRGAGAKERDQRHQRQRGKQRQARAERQRKGNRNAVDDGDGEGGRHECGGAAITMGTK